MFYRWHYGQESGLATPIADPVMLAGNLRLVDRQGLQVARLYANLKEWEKSTGFCIFADVIP